jgi:hypothetical protein
MLLNSTAQRYALRAIRPPSTSNSVPVTYFASSDAR